MKVCLHGPAIHKEGVYVTFLWTQGVKDEKRMRENDKSHCISVSKIAERPKWVSQYEVYAYKNRVPLPTAAYF